MLDRMPVETHRIDSLSGINIGIGREGVEAHKRCEIYASLYAQLCITAVAVASAGITGNIFATGKQHTSCILTANAPAVAAHEAGTVLTMVDAAR